MSESQKPVNARDIAHKVFNSSSSAPLDGILLGLFIELKVILRVFFDDRYNEELMPTDIDIMYLNNGGYTDIKEWTGEQNLHEVSMELVNALRIILTSERQDRGDFQLKYDNMLCILNLMVEDLENENSNQMFRDLSDDTLLPISRFYKVVKNEYSNDLFRNISYLELDYLTIEKIEKEADNWKLKGRARKLYVYLSKLSKMPNWDTITQAIGMTRNQLSEAFKELDKLGLTKKVGQKRELTPPDHFSTVNDFPVTITPVD